MTPFGHFEWKFMAFGLRKVPATFSRLAWKFELFSAAYLDDIAIFSSTWAEHLPHIQKILTRARINSELGKV